MSVSSTDAYWPSHADQLAYLVRVLDDVVAKDLGLALVDLEQRSEHADGGGLAGAIWAENAVHHAGGNVEVDSVDRALVPKDFDEAVGLDGPF